MDPPTEYHEDEDIAKRFRYHPPKGDQFERYEAFRGSARAFANLICDVAPASREKAIALTKLEECVMWTNAAIARNE